MNQSQQPQSNLQDEALKALSLLDPEDQEKVVEYIQALADSQNNEQGYN